MCGSGAEARFFCTICTVGVFAVLEVVMNFVESFFADEVFAFRAKIAAVDDGVHEFFGI